MINKLALKGAKEIADAVGLNHKEIPRLVKEEKLPAFKLNGKGNWLALPEDLQRWLREQRNKALGVVG